jgi:hypothetical protein
MTDGHKPVVDHHSEKEIIHTYKNQKKRHLRKATAIRNDSAMSLDGHNHIWDCGGDETYISQGQVEEEKVHGDVEVRVTADSQDDEQVAKHCDQVHGQEQSKEKGLQFWIT